MADRQSFSSGGFQEAYLGKVINLNKWPNRRPQKNLGIVSLSGKFIFSTGRVNQPLLCTSEIELFTGAGGHGFKRNANISVGTLM